MSGKFLARHGDLLIEGIDEIPDDCVQRENNVILDGEVTGHAHCLNGGTILENENDVFLEVMEEGATVTHEEHATIKLPPGDYQVFRQREFDPYEKAARAVRD